MSTIIEKFFIKATFALILFLSSSLAFSQDIKVGITKLSDSDKTIFVSLQILNDEIIDKNLSFLQSYADAENLGSRIGELYLNNGKQKVSYKKFAKGEYLAENKFDGLSFTVNLESQRNVSANAHVSWVGKTQGLLMLNDILPHFKRESITALVTFKLPSDWSVIADAQSTENQEFLRKRKKQIAMSYTIKLTHFDTNDVDKAVFVVGKNWRGKEIFVNQTKINFLILDEWQFANKLAFEMAEEITREYSKLFGGIPVKKAQIVLMDFPTPMEKGRWRAETRGGNITILSSQALAESFAKQRLHEQLRHEIFHLWIPNSLKLSGDYAWFYEGFALYQALKTGVDLGQIRFEDFLNTLEQAYFLEQKRSGGRSLINISKMRWNGEVGNVYARGLLVAFLCDTAIMNQSKGKRDLKGIFREIYKNYGRLVKKQDANEAIVKALQERRELGKIIDLYIKGNYKVDWTESLAGLGIENVGTKTNANLQIKSKLSRRQKTLLKKLGYNRRRNFVRQKINRNH